MGIRFGNIEPAAPASLPAADVIDSALTGDADAISTPQGITLDLAKGSVLDIEKVSPGLKRITVAAGWDPAMAGSKIDIDLSAYMLGGNGKLTSSDDIIYFRHMQAEGIKLNGDNTTGDGDGDDETIDIDLGAIPAKYTKIVFVANIYQAKERKQTFGMVSNSYIRLLNREEGDKEICRFMLKEEYASSTAVIFASLSKEGGSWKYEAIGEGKVVTNLNDIAAMYS